MAFEYSKLIGFIVEKYGTRRAFAEALGWTDTKLSARLNNAVPFSTVEINQVCALLGIPDEDIAAYFFTPKVR